MRVRSVILAMLLVFVLVTLMLPPVGTPREVERRMQCSNNLRRIGVAIRNYEQEYRCFMPCFIPDENGKPKHSWRVLLLPFLEEQALYRQYHFDEPWNGPHNKELVARMPSVYCCPTYAAFCDGQVISSLTSYAMIVGPHAISDGPKARKASEITDGLGNTVVLAECAGTAITWLEPLDINAEEITNVIGLGEYKNQPVGINSYHPGVANMLFCDGVVRTVPDGIDERVLKAMLTVDGGEIINADDLR